MKIIRILKPGPVPFFYGFFSGLIILILIYIIIFQVAETDFTFQEFSRLHSGSVYLYFLDFLPLAAGILTSMVTAKTMEMKDSYEILIQKEKEEQKMALSMLESLKKSEFTARVQINPENDLHKSLDDLRLNLKRDLEKEEQRKKEDQQRSWASEGLAGFSEILRQPGEKMEDFAYVLTSRLVKYLDANQGSFFIIGETDSSGKFLNMLACHAYNRRKFANKKIEWGTGLIGNCALEGKSVYMTNIPDDYPIITSGLGKATPDYLLLLPLVTGNEVYGVLEIASFKRIEEFQLAFCEKLAESIAMTIAGIKSTARTSLLLKETKMQAEELAVQEEKMRVSMEELRATQEQAAKEAEKFISFTNTVNHTLIRAEYDAQGVLLYANTKFLNKMGFSGNREVEGMHITTFIHEIDREWFSSIWEGLSRGGKHFEGYMKHITKQGQDFWTLATYTCVRKDDGSVEKILFLAIDSTEHKKQSLDFEGQIEAINKLNLKAEFSPDGKLLVCNELFNNSLKYPGQELNIKSIFDFLDHKELESFNDIWEQVIKGNPYQGQVKFITRLNEEKWFRSTFSSVINIYGEVSKVVFLANEITNERLMEMESRKQAEQMKAQEEKLRIASLEMEGKMKNEADRWAAKLDRLNERLLISERIIDAFDELILSVDNSGNIVYMNENACKYWKLKRKEVEGLPALLVFETSERSYPGFFMNFIDPAKSKSNQDSPVSVPGAGNTSYKFTSIINPLELNGRIIFTAHLKREIV